MVDSYGITLGFMEFGMHKQYFRLVQGEGQKRLGSDQLAETIMNMH